MTTYTPENPKYSSTLPITETTDPAHADNINAGPKQVFDNTVALKGMSFGDIDLYSSTSEYAVGSLCIKDGKVYKSNTEIPEGGEEWNADHWDIYTLYDRVESVVTPIFDDSGTVEGISDYNSFYQSIKSKMNIFQFFRNLKAGLSFLLNVGQLVNDGATNNPNLPAGAQGLYKLAQDISSLNSQTALRGFGSPTTIMCGADTGYDYQDVLDIPAGTIAYVYQNTANAPNNRDTWFMLVFGLAGNMGYLAISNRTDTPQCMYAVKHQTNGFSGWKAL